MTRRTGDSGGDPRVTAHGARFDGGAGGIHVGGNIHADVTASAGGDEALRAAVSALVQHLRREAAGSDAELADLTAELEEAAQERSVPRRRVRTLLRAIEHHPAFTGAASGLMEAALGLAAGG